MDFAQLNQVFQRLLGVQQPSEEEVKFVKEFFLLTLLLEKVVQQCGQLQYHCSDNLLPTLRAQSLTDSEALTTEVNTLITGCARFQNWLQGELRNSWADPARIVDYREQLDLVGAFLVLLRSFEKSLRN